MKIQAAFVMAQTLSKKSLGGSHTKKRSTGASKRGIAHADELLKALNIQGADPGQLVRLQQ